MPVSQTRHSTLQTPPTNSRVVQREFVPIKPDGGEGGYRGKRKLWVIAVQLFVLVLVLTGLYIVIENPVLPIIKKRLFLESAELTWSGLVVKTSGIVLVVFLILVLFRYVFQIMMAVWHSIRYTIQFGKTDPQFTPPISIIVPAYNEGKLIRNTLGSLLALDYPQFEIIMVDDGSTDDTERQVEGYLGQHGNATVRLVSKPNGGKATALNAGVQVAKYDFVLCADGDSHLTPDTLRMAIRHMKDPKIGAVSGNVKVMNRNNFWTIFQALEYIEGLNITRAAQSSLRLVNIIPGPVGLFRKQIIKDVGWYTSDTFAEDADMTLKILRKGWKIVHEPLSISWTEAPNTLFSLIKQRYRWTRGILQAIQKNRREHWSSFGAWLLLWFMIVEAVIWPFASVFATLFFIYVALTYNITYYLLLWWLGLTFLDMAMALFAVASEREEVRLVFYAAFYRLFFALIIDICKVFATIEEFLGVRMNWGKLERIGTPRAQQHPPR